MVKSKNLFASSYTRSSPAGYAFAIKVSEGVTTPTALQNGT
jgi:hypothetical protein